MSKRLILPGVLALGAMTFSSCATKTEVVAMQPVSRPSYRPVSKPAPVAKRTAVKVQRVGNPKPSPWATDVVNSYDQKD